ncbi:putative myosin-2 heavy chain [Cercophora samala]|uniref:Myosin-2 heavy chain n=1 Tax=Cercophora samala TaxID=330535 RepID=A0AA40D7M1_9PEZI|nr:putative myosin-2 heavy chain [Cercophora samala]
MSRQGAHEWGGRPPPTGPKSRPPNKKRRAEAHSTDSSETWVRPEWQSYRPARSPSPKRHKPEPPSDSEAYGDFSYTPSTGIAIKGSAGNRRHSSATEEEDKGPPAQLGDYQVRRQSSADIEERPAGGRDVADVDFRGGMPFPDYFPQAAPWVMDRVRDKFRKLWEFLELPNLDPVRPTWHPLVTGTLSELERIESFCDFINAKRRELHGQTLDYKRQLSKYEKDYRAQLEDMEGFKKETEKYRRQVTKLENEADAYKKQIAKLESDNSQQAAELDLQRKRTSKLDQQLGKQIVETDTYKKKADKLEEDCTKQAADIEAYKNQVVKLEEDNSRLLAEVEDYKRQTTELKTDKKSPDAGSEGGQSQVCKPEVGKIPVVSPEDYRLKAPKGPRRWSVDTDNQAPRSPTKDKAVEMEGYRTQTRKLEETCKEQAAQIKGCRMEIERWRQDFHNLGAEKERCKVDIGHLQQELGRVEKELESVVAHKNRRGETIRHLEDKLAAMATKKDPRMELFKVRKEKEKLSNDYDALKARYDGQLAMFQNLERETAEQKKKFTTIRVEHQRSIDKIKAEKQELERRILEIQKTPSGNNQQSPDDHELAAPDIDQLMGGMEPKLPPTGVPKQLVGNLPKSAQQLSVDEFLGEIIPASSAVRSTTAPVNPQAATPGLGKSTISTPTTAGLSQPQEGQVKGGIPLGADHGYQELIRYQAMVREKDEKLKQLTAENVEVQKLLGEKITQIEKELQTNKARLQQQQAQGLDDKPGSDTVNAILKSRVDKLLIKDKDKDTALKQLRDAKFKLEYLMEEKDDKYKQLHAVNVSLQGMVQEKTSIVERLEEERNRLQGELQARDNQIQALEGKICETEAQLREEADKLAKLRQILGHKEAEISTLRAASSLPGTPVSAVSNASFQIQIPQVTSSDDGLRVDKGTTLGLSAQQEPTVFIKRERADTGCELPVIETMAQDQDLRKGIVSLLGDLFSIPPSQKWNNDTLVKFVSHLGSGLDATTGPNNASADMALVNDAWTLRNVWAQDCAGNTGQSHLQETLAGKFAHLCLLLSLVREGQDDMGTCQLLGELSLSLLSADHSQLPLAGMAFLDCVASSQAKPERVKARVGLMAILICELCRHLQRVLQAPKRNWGIKEILGMTEDEAPETSTIWKLATILGEEDTRSEPLETRKRLAQTCSDKFSFFYQTDEDNKEREIGLLSCSSGMEDDANSQIFLMLDFEKRWIRLVDCSLAYFTSNRAAPRMLDLVIAREDAEKKEEVELFKIEAAPKDVAAFWLRNICYGG